MTVLCWSHFILLLGFIYCYENLSRRSTTTLSQSSTYRNRSALYANDDNLQTQECVCAHTATGSPIAWFQVDLGEEYSIKNVKIYYRKEGDGPNDWKQYRFKHFYLDVSNSSAAVTNTAQRTRCYTDRSTGLPDNIKDIPCNQTARYVIVETTYDAPEDDPVKGAVLEICEIQVYGCDSAHYGLNCSQQCDVNCKDRVCNSNGFCTLGCKSGFYGNTCKNACPSCPSGCNRNSGDCEGTCPNDRYGKQCNLPCSPGCTGGCNRDTGACDRGCVVGKFGSNCSENCNTGCIADCDQNDGRCECKTGWQGDKCDDCRSDYHGHLCEQRCSSHCVNGICFSNNGTCVGGSAGKFSNDKCTQENVQSSTTECDSSMLIVSIVVSVVIVLTGSAVNFLLWRRNQSQNVKGGLKENSNSPNTTAHEPSDIPNSENQDRSPYAELGDLDKPNTYEDLHQYTEAV